MKKITSKIVLAGITMLMVLNIVSVRDVSATTATTANTPDNTNTSYTLLEPLPNLESGGVVTNVQFKDYVQYFFNLIIALSAAAAVFMIVLGGFQYMTTDSWQGKSEGIDKVKNALIGLLVVLSSYLLLKTIDPRLVEIPSTLVKPLQIQYSKKEGSILDKFAALVDTFKFDNRLIKEQLEKNKAELAALDKKNGELLTELNKVTGGNYTSADDVLKNYDEICKTGGTAKDLCIQIIGNQETKNNIESDTTYKMGEALMNEVIRGCYGLSGNDKDAKTYCQKQIIDYMTKYGASLRDGGSPDKASSLSQYASYSRATIEMFDAVQKNIPDRTYTSAFIDTYKDIASAGLDNYGGEAIGSGAVNLIGGYIDQKDAERAAAAIVESYNTYVGRINNDDIKSKLTKQTNSMLENLKVKTRVGQ